MYVCVCVCISCELYFQLCFTHRLRHVGVLTIAPLEELVMPAFFDCVGFMYSFQPFDRIEKQLKDKVSSHTPPPASELERALAHVHAPSLISHPFSTLCLEHTDLVDVPECTSCPAAPEYSQWSLFWDFLSLPSLCMGILCCHSNSRRCRL